MVNFGRQAAEVFEISEVFEITHNNAEVLPNYGRLRSRRGHYIFALWFLLSFFFFSSPNLSRRRLDVCHTWCGLSANLGCRSKTWSTRLAEIQHTKNRQKIATWAPSHNFVGLYIRNYSTYQQSKKNLLSSNSPAHGLTIW